TEHRREHRDPALALLREPEFGWAKCPPVVPGRPSKVSNRPHAYLTLPTSCEEPLDFRLSVRSWDASEPQPTPRETSGKQTLEGCEALPFDPRASAQLSDPHASSPSGYA